MFPTKEEYYLRLFSSFIHILYLVCLIAIVFLVGYGHDTSAIFVFWIFFSFTLIWSVLMLVFTKYSLRIVSTLSFYIFTFVLFSFSHNNDEHTFLVAVLVSIVLILLVLSFSDYIRNRKAIKIFSGLADKHEKIIMLEQQYKRNNDDNLLIEIKELNEEIQKGLNEINRLS